MKLKLLTPIFTLLALSVSYGLELSGEAGFYGVKLKGGYERQVGYNLWDLKKEGFLFKLDFGEEFSVGEGTRFRLSVTTGTTKAPYVTVFTPSEERLFPGTVRNFNLKELFFEKDRFLLRELSLRAGKQKFNLFPLIDDYLWGGTFTFKLPKGVSFTWYQVAGYEGKYLLFNSQEEDDVDLFGGNVAYKTPLGKLSVGFFRISDARGEKTGVNRDTFLFTFRPEVFKGFNALFSGALQNGRGLLALSLKVRYFELAGGCAEKGFTSYGFREGVRDLGYIYRPTFSDVVFLKAETRFLLKGFGFKFHSLYVDSLGSEVGGEVSYPFYKGELFFKGALGTDGSYFTYAGYRWGARDYPFPEYLGSLKVENYFNLWGEYADLPQRSYSPQVGYEGWEKAEHVGYWHSTYKLSLKSEEFSLKVSTGKDSKVDYVIWGNTADNFLYSQTHGKLWHFEEAYYSLAPFSFGLQRVEVAGFISEYLTGIGFSKGVRFGAFADEGDKYLFLSFPFREGELHLFHKSGGLKTYLFGVSKDYGFLSIGYLKEFFDGGRRAWGTFVKGETELFGLRGGALLRVYSKNFTTFRLREFFRDDGFIYRPGERDCRFLRLKLSKELAYKFSPEVSLIYDRLSRFSGSYVGEEWGALVSLKVGKKCRLEVVELSGSNNTFYHGLRFSLTW